MRKCARCKQTFPAFLELKAHACSKKVHKGKNRKPNNKKSMATIIRQKKQMTLQQYVTVFPQESEMKNQRITITEDNKNQQPSQH